MAPLNEDIIKFQELSRLSDYRAGILLASNGMLVVRARNGGRFFSSTEELIKRNLEREARKRGLELSAFKTLSPKSDQSQRKAASA